MRKIEFRAWDGEKYWEDVVPLFSTMEIILNNPLAGNKLHKVESFQEFTGLLDKSRKKIFEGDIVKHQEFGIGKIVWFAETGYGIEKQISSFGRKTSTHLGSMLTKEMCEVVGNIYQDTELLNVK